MNKKLICFLLVICCIQFTLSFVGCIDNNDYNDIQLLVNQAKEGETIILKKGIYNCSIVLDKSIKFVGQGMEKTIIIYDNKSFHNSVIEILADNCTISNMSILNYNEIEKTSIIGINISSSNNIIFNISISNFSIGINVEPNTQNNYVNNNKIIDNYKAIDFKLSKFNNISSNVIQNSIYGLYLRDGYNNEIFQNMFFNNQYGFRLKGERYSTIIKNNFQNNEYGIYICCAAQYNNIYCNNFYDNNISAYDFYDNYWDNGIIGNYWSSYDESYEGALDENLDGIADSPYKIPNVKNFDNYPKITDCYS